MGHCNNRFVALSKPISGKPIDSLLIQVEKTFSASILVVHSSILNVNNGRAAAAAEPVWLDDDTYASVRSKRPRRQIHLPISVWQPWHSLFLFSSHPNFKSQTKGKLKEKHIFSFWTMIQLSRCSLKNLLLLAARKKRAQISSANRRV